MEEGITANQNTPADGANQNGELHVVGANQNGEPLGASQNSESGDTQDCDNKRETEANGDQNVRKDENIVLSEDKETTTKSGNQNCEQSKLEAQAEENKIEVNKNKLEENEMARSQREANETGKKIQKKEAQIISIDKRSKDDSDLGGPTSRGVNFNLNNTESDSEDNVQNGRAGSKRFTADMKLFNMPNFPESPGKLPQKGEQQLKALVQSRDSKHLKQWLRNNHWPVGHPIRNNLWVLTCQYVFKSQSSIYHEMVDDLFKDDFPEVLPLPLFVDTEHLPQYCLTPAGVDSVHLILIVLDQLNPDVTFCPILFPVSALFLHFMEPEQCFNCLYSMIRTTESRYFPQTNVAVDATYLVMRDLAKHHAKSAYTSIFKDTDGSVEPVFRNWIWWIFTYLPFPILVPVMDCFLYEGMKVLYRVALAILILFQKHTVKLHEPHSPLLGVNVSARIKHFCEDMPYSVDKLLKTAFGIRGLGRKELRKLQVRHEMYEKSQTVRMTRASSFARPNSRNSFSVAPPPSRSLSIPAPLSHKRTKTKGDTISHDLDTDSSDEDSETLLTVDPVHHHDHYERSGSQKGEKVKPAHVDHSAQTISYDNQAASMSTGVNTDSLSPEPSKRHVHYDLSKSSRQELAKVKVDELAEVKVTHPKGHSEKRHTGRCQFNEDDDADEQCNGPNTALTSDPHDPCACYGSRSRLPSHYSHHKTKVKGQFKHAHIDEDDSEEAAPRVDPHVPYQKPRTSSYHKAKVKGHGKMYDQKHLINDDDSETALTSDPYSHHENPRSHSHHSATSDPFSPHEKPRSQSHHSAKVKLKGKRILNKHAEEETELVPAGSESDTQVTSDPSHNQDVTSDPYSPHEKPRSKSHHSAKVKLKGKRILDKHEEEETELVPAGSESDTQVTSDPSHNQDVTSDPYSPHEKPRSQSHHSAKVKLKGKRILNKHEEEETELVPAVSESDTQVTSDPSHNQDVTSDPSHIQDDCTECQPNAKARCNCKIKNIFKRKKQKKQVEQEPSDPDLPSTSKQRSRTNSRSRPKSIRDHRAKIRALGAFSLRGRSKRKKPIEIEETLPQSSSSDIIDAPRSRSLTHLHVEMVDCFTLTHKDLMFVWSWLPARYTICQPHLLFTTELHGISLATLYRRIGHHEPTLLIIKTGNNEIFGAFCSTDWRERTGKGQNRHLAYFGTGETFVFTLSPKKKVYYWVGMNNQDYPTTANMFLAADHKALQVGGGNGTAIHLDAGLVHCRTERCDTFDNEPLCSSVDFQCKVLEVFGFQ